MDVKTIVNRVEDLGVVLTVNGDKIQYRPASLVPPKLIAAMKDHKAELLEYLKPYTLTEHEDCWLLEEWRRISIPDWRRILRQSISNGDREREDYARWMLREILDDSNYDDQC